MPTVSYKTYFSDEMDKWWFYYEQLTEKGLGAYHRPDYFLFQEKVDFGRAVLQVFQTSDRFIYYPGLLRPLPEPEKGFDIDSGWYYGGPVSSRPCLSPLEPAWTKVINSARRELDVTAEFIRFDPNLQNYSLFDGFMPVEYNRETVVVDLQPGWPVVWKNFSSQNRRNVRKATESRLIVEKRDDHACWKSFRDIYMEEMIRKNAPKHLRFSAEFFDALQELACMDLFVISCQDQIIGGFIAATGKHIAHHFLSATRHEFWDIRPNNLLFTEVIKYYHQNGFLFFDFQGGREGVFRFKCNFSDNRRKFYVGKKIFDHDKYDRLSQSIKTNFFPAYRENT